MYIRLYIMPLCRICYERVSWQPTLMTFLLSSAWHGYYPGYYLCLVSFSIMLQGAKKVIYLQPLAFYSNLSTWRPLIIVFILHHDNYLVDHYNIIHDDIYVDHYFFSFKMLILMEWQYLYT